MLAAPAVVTLLTVQMLRLEHLARSIHAGHYRNFISRGNARSLCRRSWEQVDCGLDGGESSAEMRGSWSWGGARVGNTGNRLGGGRDR